MTIIAIQCPACRTTDDIPAPALFVDADAPTADNTGTGEAGSAATVIWVCGSCAELVSVPVEWAPLLAVVAAGATLIDTSSDLDSSDVEDVRPAHPESPTGGALLTPDDLLDFHQALGGADWLDELCTSAEPQLGAGAA
ncbi:MAG: hypothetical protein ACXV2I_07925 [Actinomycetes bacterium]